MTESNNNNQSSPAEPKVTCRYHPDSYLIEDYRAGDMICHECGLVVGDRTVNVEAEWRTMNQNSEERMHNPSRVGNSEEPWSVAGLQTKIAALPGGSCTLKAPKRCYSDTIFANCCSTLDDIGVRLNLTRCDVTGAKTLFKKYFKDNRYRAMKKQVMAVAFLYFACKSSSPRTVNELSVVCNIASKELAACIRRLMKDLASEVSKNDDLTNERFLPRYCGQLKLSMAVQTKAAHFMQEIPKKIERLDHTKTLTAVSMYMAVVVELNIIKEKDLKDWRKRISQLCEVPEGTIGKISNEYTRI